MKLAGATASTGVTDSPLAGAQGPCSYGIAPSVTTVTIKLYPGLWTLPVRAAMPSLAQGVVMVSLSSKVLQE